MNRMHTLALVYSLAFGGSWAAFAADEANPAVTSNPLRSAFYGDLHLHTKYSFDSYVLRGTKVDPDEAYRFAKGESVDYLGKTVQRREPLDFLAVADHSEYIGVLDQLEDPNSVTSKSQIGREFRAALETRDIRNLFELIDRYIVQGEKPTPSISRVSESVWEHVVDAANRHYQPGKFTTFIAYEWTPTPNGANLHRNVIFRGATAPALFTSIDSKDPEDLWSFLERGRSQGFDAIAIPHNGNVSDGLMYGWTRFNGRPVDRAYAQMRQANEPLTEISQNKGSSETHSTLSSSDEFANFEIFDRLLTGEPRLSKTGGSYVRDALGRGLVLQRIVGSNPYKYGFVGGSDLHSGLSVSAQADYAGNNGAVNLGGGMPTREQVADAFKGGTDVGVGLATTSGSLTGVWAESNTRESIYNAFRRREVFATTGPKIKLRFFAAWGLDKKLLSRRDWVKIAYEKSVSMGRDLPANTGAARAPSFAIWAIKDPNGANLDRVQVIKVWEEDGQQQERIYDVFWSDHRVLHKKTGKLPIVGNTVDVTTGTYKNTIGAVELSGVWTDPAFNPRHLAAYYLRVLEIPTPRWSTLLAIEHGLPHPEGVPASVQQRGWSSPIWYTRDGS